MFSGVAPEAGFAFAFTRGLQPVAHGEGGVDTLKDSAGQEGAAF